MKKMGFYTLFTLLLFLILTANMGCGSSSGTAGRYNPKSRIGLPSYIFDDACHEETDWNFLVYLDGDNNLEPFAIKDLNEMEMVGSIEGFLTVLVLIDRHPGYDFSNGNWTGTRLYKVTTDKNGVDQEIVSELLYDFGEVDMSHPDTLRDFVWYCQEKYPAAKSVLTLWDHGEGFKPRSLAQSSPLPFSKGICVDDTTGGLSEESFLTTKELAQALEEAQNLSGKSLQIINMDACLMQMIEIAYELKDVTEWLVGSEDIVPADGNCYDELLKLLSAEPPISAEDFAQEMVKAYCGFYARENETATYSAINLNNSPETAFRDLIDSFHRFVLLLNVEDNCNTIISAYNNTTRFTYEDVDPYFLDLADFCQELGLLLNDESLENLKSAATEVKERIEDAVYSKKTGDFADGDLFGLSIYFPNKQDWAYYNKKESYLGLEFAQDTKWDEFLTAITSFMDEP